MNGGSLKIKGTLSVGPGHEKGSGIRSRVTHSIQHVLYG